MTDLRTLIDIVEQAQTAKTFFDGAFYLPPDVLHYYDDPFSGRGDDGWSVDELVDEIRQDGEVIYSIAVGKSRHEVEQNNDHRVFVYNGNHRLAAAKKLSLARIICEPSASDDAMPLTRDEILALGGTLVQ